MAGGTALGLSYRIPAEYEAKAKVFVGPRSIDKSDAAGALQELTFSEQFVASYAEILKSRSLAERVIAKTKAPFSPADLSSRVETNIIPATRLIEVVVTDSDPERAQLFANELVATFAQDPGNQLGTVSIDVLDSALKPTDPVSPKPLRNGLMGAGLGMFLGVGVAFAIERLDTAVRTREDVERFLAPLAVIGQIPLSAGRKSGKVFMQGDPESPAAEALRMLRTNVQFFSPDDPVRSVLVTSPFASDGKTTVASNLAASMAALGSTVLLIETDLRKPVLHKLLDVQSRPGLSNVLARQAGLSEAVQPTSIPNLSVVTAGDVAPNPSELLGSVAMVDLINAAEGMADVVILDTPPALPVTDAAILAPHTDGVILVVRAGRTDVRQAAEVVNDFTRHDVRMLGVVINGLDRDSEGDYNYRYNYYRSAKTGGNRRLRRFGKKPDQTQTDAFLEAPRKPARRQGSDEPLLNGSSNQPSQEKAERQ